MAVMINTQRDRKFQRAKQQRMSSMNVNFAWANIKREKKIVVEMHVCLDRNGKLAWKDCSRYEFWKSSSEAQTRW